MQVRKCSLCKETKDEKLFYKNKNAKSGYRSECRQCHLAKVKSYYHDNKEKCQEYSRNYYIKNRELISEKRRVSYREKIMPDDSILDRIIKLGARVNEQQ